MCSQTIGGITIGYSASAYLWYSLFHRQQNRTLESRPTHFYQQQNIIIFFSPERVIVMSKKKKKNVSRGFKGVFNYALQNQSDHLLTTTNIEQ